MAEHIRKRLDGLVAGLGKAANLPNLALDGNGCCSLSLDGLVYTLRYHEPREALYFIHDLGELPAPAEERARVAVWLLERDCFFRGVGAGVLGVNEGRIYYCARLDPAELEYLDLESFLLAVADTCAGLGRDMEALPSAPANSGGETEQSELNMIRI